MGSLNEPSEDQDVAELRRNLATKKKDTGDASSASELTLFNASGAERSIAR